jgi:hypothetical protein
MANRIEMQNKRYAGRANVLPDDVPVWEAAGWTAVKPKSSKKKDIDE